MSVDGLKVWTQQTQSSLELRTKFTGIQPFCAVVLEPLLSKQRMSSNFFPDTVAVQCAYRHACNSTVNGRIKNVEKRTGTAHHYPFYPYESRHITFPKDVRRLYCKDFRKTPTQHACHCQLEINPWMDPPDAPAWSNDRFRCGDEHAPGLGGASCSVPQRAMPGDGVLPEGRLRLSPSRQAVACPPPLATRRRCAK